MFLNSRKRNVPYNCKWLSTFVHQAQLLGYIGFCPCLYVCQNNFIRSLQHWRLLNLRIFSKTWSHALSTTPSPQLVIKLNGVSDYRIWRCILSGIYVLAKIVWTLKLVLNDWKDYIYIYYIGMCILAVFYVWEKIVEMTAFGLRSFMCCL